VLQRKLASFAKQIEEPFKSNENIDHDATLKNVTNKLNNKTNEEDTSLNIKINSTNNTIDTNENSYVNNENINKSISEDSSNTDPITSTEKSILRQAKSLQDNSVLQQQRTTSTIAISIPDFNSSDSINTLTSKTHRKQHSMSDESFKHLPIDRNAPNSSSNRRRAIKKTRVSDMYNNLK
jgi:hypothetical protein